MQPEPNSLRLKSYFAGSVEAAMSLARKEMGDDAMLIHSRQAAPESRHLGAYEVVFGIHPGDERRARQRELRREIRAVPAPKAFEPIRQPAAAAAALAATPEDPQEAIFRQMAQLREEMERVLRSLGQRGVATIPELAEAPTAVEAQPIIEAPGDAVESGSPPASLRQTPQKPQVENDFYRLLVEQEVDPEIARQTSSARSLENVFEVSPELGRAGSDRVIVALIGPPGAGKTTTIAKLAARYALAARKKAHILSIDILRIGASDQMRTLASLLGIGFGLAQTPSDLDSMIEEQYKKDLIFIDTPGLAKAEMEDSRELAQMLGSDPDVDTHLVLPSSMRLHDLANQVERFRAFRPRKLIFTRIDEASRFGALVSVASQAGLPVSFLTQGQRIPDDLEPASKESLLELLGVRRDASEAGPALGRGAAA